MMGEVPHPVDDKQRLAPAFVEWMQGFDAGWTAGMSRTQALKALGNAVVAPQAILALATLTEGLMAADTAHEQHMVNKAPSADDA